MNLCKCTFDELPAAMQTYILYIQKIPVSEYRLIIWRNKDTLYYNDLKKSEIKRFVALIESERKFLNNRTMNSIYNKYGYVVYNQIHEAHNYLLKKKQEQIAESTVAEYMPIIEKAMNKPSIPLNYSLLKAMSQTANKGKFKFEEWSTNETYIYFMGYLLGSGKLKWERQLL